MVLYAHVYLLYMSTFCVICVMHTSTHQVRESILDVRESVLHECEHISHVRIHHTCMSLLHRYTP